MSETGKLIDQKQGVAPGTEIWDSLREFGSLPGWLVAIRDDGRVSQALQDLVPEFCEEGWALKDCAVTHIRYKNEAWQALYGLTARRPGAEQDEIIELQGKNFLPGTLAAEPPEVTGRLGEQGWRAVIPGLDLILETREPDSELDSLRFLTEAEETRRYLEAVLRAHSPEFAHVRLKSVSPRVVRYNRGSRCTVVCQLEYARDRQPNWPELVVAKTYHGEKGRNAFESMSALWYSPLGSSPLVKIAQPLAYHPEQRVLVQGPIREEYTLEELVFRSVQELPEAGQNAQDLTHYMRMTAAGLAALHNSGVKMGQHWTWKDQLDEVDHQVRRLANVLPHLRVAAAPLLERLDRLAARTPPDPCVPSHGTFRAPQVLIHQGEIGFIDFDSFRQSEPADDLALFLGEMLNSGLAPQRTGDRRDRQPLDPAVLQQRFDYLMSVQNQFLETYRRSHPVTLERVAIWEALDMFMFVLHDWTKVKLADLDSTFFLLERFLKASGIA